MVSSSSSSKSIWLSAGFTINGSTNVSFKDAGLIFSYPGSTILTDNYAYPHFKAFNTKSSPESYNYSSKCCYPWALIWDASYHGNLLKF
jgi:hypothetical protein